jgi:diadenylate cyclase
MTDSVIQQAARVMSQLNVWAVVDILILTFLIYGLSSILRGTRAETLVRGLIILFGFAFIMVTIFPLPVLRWLVTNSFPFLIFAILVIFGPELRRALERIGHTGDFLGREIFGRTQESIPQAIEEVITAAFYLSNQGWGGLMVIERETGLSDLANKGFEVDARVTSQLLGNIFVPNTPLHDGAVIIQGDRIAAAKVVLPLSEGASSNEHFGTRHKAALGLSEQSDAAVIVVSEETSAVSLAYNGKLHYKLDRERLRFMLRSLLEPSGGESRSWRFAAVRRVANESVAANGNGKAKEDDLRTNPKLKEPKEQKESKEQSEPVSQSNKR